MGDLQMLMVVGIDGVGALVEIGSICVGVSLEGQPLESKELERIGKNIQKLLILKRSITGLQEKNVFNFSNWCRERESNPHSLATSSF